MDLKFTDSATSSNGIFIMFSYGSPTYRIAIYQDTHPTSNLLYQQIVTDFTDENVTLDYDGSILTLYIDEINVFQSTATTLYKIVSISGWEGSTASGSVNVTLNNLAIPPTPTPTGSPTPTPPPYIVYLTVNNGHFNGTITDLTTAEKNSGTYVCHVHFNIGDSIKVEVSAHDSTDLVLNYYTLVIGSYSNSWGGNPLTIGLGIGHDAYITAYYTDATPTGTPTTSPTASSTGTGTPTPTATSTGSPPDGFGLGTYALIVISILVIFGVAVIGLLVANKFKQIGDKIEC